MVKKILATALTLAVVVQVSAADWAADGGSAYQKGDKNITVGFSLANLGFFGIFDYGFHEAISGGAVTGFHFWGTGYWKYREISILGRANFHPFNLKVLADKISIRNKLDVYVGIAVGGQIGWVDYDGPFANPVEPDVGGFSFRENIGARFYPTENFFLTIEEGLGLGILNFGCGLKF